MEKVGYNLSTHAALHMKRRRISTKPLHLMLLPAVALVFVYSYLPMLGNVIAFMNFDIYKGLSAFWQSEWIGLENYRQLLTMGDPANVLINTVNISLQKIIAGLVVPIVVALLLNEIGRSSVKRTLQTIVYMPNFLSWVILAGIIKQVLSGEGIVNNLIASMGGDKIPFLQSNQWFVSTLVATDIWKNFGFNTIVYLAAITGIDPSLYEAAIVDGANRWKQTLHVTLPGMMGIIVLVTVLSLQGVLNAGFDQIFNLYSPQVYKTGDIIDTFVYRISFQSTTPMYSLATAIGLFKSLVSSILIALSYWLAYRFAKYQVF